MITEDSAVGRTEEVRQVQELKEQNPTNEENQTNEGRRTNEGNQMNGEKQTKERKEMPQPADKGDGDQKKCGITIESTAVEGSAAVGETAVEARNLSYRYRDGSHPLRNLSFQVRYGEMVFLTGESGSGKTSTLNLILGMDRPSGGDLIVLGENMYRVKTRGVKNLRRNIGTVFQSFRLQKDRTALQNVALPLRFLGGGKIKARAMQALEQVGLSGKENKKVMNLSQGERQRVAIARAIVGGAKLIIADEPTGNLDTQNSRTVLDILNGLAEAGAAVLVTTHAVHLIPEYPASRQYAIHDGTAEEVTR